MLSGAAAEEPAGLALGGQDVGVASDAELRCSRAGQPGAVPEADLVVGGQVDRDRLLDAAGCCAEAAGGCGPGRLAGAGTEGGKGVPDCRGGRAADQGKPGGGVICPGQVSRWC
jgi:hypothetical protein